MAGFATVLLGLGFTASPFVSDSFIPLDACVHDFLVSAPVASGGSRRRDGLGLHIIVRHGRQNGTGRLNGKLFRVFKVRDKTLRLQPAKPILPGSQAIMHKLGMNSKIV